MISSQSGVPTSQLVANLSTFVKLIIPTSKSIITPYTPEFMDKQTSEWLLQSDPSVAFQTMRDLLDRPRKQWLAEKEKMLQQGWVKQLLDLQDPSGTWGSGLYGPKYISTHYTLLLLRRLEMPHTRNISRACKELIKIDAIGNITTTDPKRIDACITGMGLSILSHFEVFDHIYVEIIEYLEENQMEDGGWNCRRPREETTHSSMNTTLSVLEGLRELAIHDHRYISKVKRLRDPAHEFLLSHDLYKSHTTGKIIHNSFIDISFPPRWKYNILSAMDYFQSIDHLYDDRMADAIQLIKQRERNGKWPQGQQLSGKTFFSTNISGEGSPFNTLRALRVLRKYPT